MSQEVVASIAEVLVRRTRGPTITAYEEDIQDTQVDAIFDRWSKGDCWEDTTKVVKPFKGALRRGSLLAWVSMKFGMPVAQFVVVRELTSSSGLRRIVFMTIQPALVETRYTFELRRGSTWRARVEKEWSLVSQLLYLKPVWREVEKSQKKSAKAAVKIAKSGELERRRPL